MQRGKERRRKKLDRKHSQLPGKKKRKKSEGKERKSSEI
jgi:hypothetical protein